VLMTHSKASQFESQKAVASHHNTIKKFFVAFCKYLGTVCDLVSGQEVCHSH
jgi:hypothetical protein